MLQCFSCPGGFCDRWLDELPRGEEKMDARVFIECFWMNLASPFGMGGFISRRMALKRLALLDVPLLWSAPANKVTVERGDLEQALARAKQGETVYRCVEDLLTAQRARDAYAFKSGYHVSFWQARRLLPSPAPALAPALAPAVAPPCPPPCVAPVPGALPTCCSARASCRWGCRRRST